MTRLRFATLATFLASAVFAGCVSAEEDLLGPDASLNQSAITNDPYAPTVPVDHNSIAYDPDQIPDVADDGTRTWDFGIQYLIETLPGLASNHTTIATEPGITVPGRRYIPDGEGLLPSLPPRD